MHPRPLNHLSVALPHIGSRLAGRALRGMLQWMLRLSQKVAAMVARVTSPQLTEQAARPQFGLQAVLWTTVLLGLTLAYLRQFELMIVLQLGAAAVLLALAFGLALSPLGHGLREGFFWSAAISAAAYFATLGQAESKPFFAIAWIAVGAAAGACSGVVPAGRRAVRIAASAAIAAVIMLALAPWLPVSAIERRFDIACAPLIGALVAVLVELIHWLEQRWYAPRYVTACWLLAAVLLGNLLVGLLELGP